MSFYVSYLWVENIIKAVAQVQAWRWNTEWFLWLKRCQDSWPQMPSGITDKESR